MGIERSRVMEVRARGGTVGASYLIDDRLLLTAGSGRAPADVRPAGTATWLAATPVWSSPAGAVLLELVLLAGARAVPVSALAGEPGFAGLVGDDRGALALADVSTPATVFPML